MKLSISNIGWQVEDDASVYEMMRKHGFTGLEIAPTRVFPETPYDKISEAKEWAKQLREKEGFVVPSMQSIWFGRSEKMFESDEERRILLDYTKKAIDFAEASGCKNLVFGCPRNRNLPKGADPGVAVGFFRELGEYALLHNTVIGMEANPPVYNTNYINDTASAIELIEQVDSKGFRLNLDLSTMIINGEEMSQIADKTSLINHVHISEPGLKLIEKRNLHSELMKLLKRVNYEGFVSIEMGKRDNLSEIENSLEYVASLS